MNTGAEAVESGIKVARKWGYRVKGVPAGRAQIIVAGGNFHGRTTTIVSFSDDPDARDDFGPYTPGFVTVPYGDLDALRAAITDDTVAVLLEPIQGEAGVRIPPPGYLAGVREVTRERNVLFIADEIQSGPRAYGRDARLRARGRGARRLPAGQGARRRHRAGLRGRRRRRRPRRAAAGRSTAARSAATRWPAPSAREVVAMLATGEFQERATRLGDHLRTRLEALVGRGVVGVRVRGLWAGVDIDPALGTGREVCEALARRRVLAKDTHGSTIRLAPPLVITEEQLDAGLDALEAVLRDLAA